VHVNFGENANLVLVKHMDSKECQRDAQLVPGNSRRENQDQATICVGSKVVLSAQAKQVDDDFKWSDEALAPGVVGTVVAFDADGDPRVRWLNGKEDHYSKLDIEPVADVDEREVRGRDVCFPWSVHKLLGNSNKKAKKRLEAMTNGMYGFPDIKAALQGTGVKIVQLDLEFPVIPESLEPGSYVFGEKGHMVGVCIRGDHSVVVHDNGYTSGVGRFRPRNYYRAYKLCFEDDTKQQHCFPWSVSRLLGQSNMDAQKRLKEMSDGPYEIRDLRAALEGTGVELVGLKLQNSLLPESLPAGNYVLGRKGHVVGVCVRDDGGLEVHDNQNPNGIGQCSLADYCCAWKLLSNG
jgi:hypothetical protein